MTDERRKATRAEVDLETSIILDQRELSGNLVNVSEHGAFVRIGPDDNGEVSESDTGRPVSLVIRNGSEPLLRKGSVCRYLEYRSHKYLAIDFGRPPD